MNSKTKIDRDRRSLTASWRETFRRRRMHDPMLVLNMSIFNFDDGWNRILSRHKVHTIGT